MVKVFCSYCGDRLVGSRWRHATRRYDETFRPDMVTLWGAITRLHRGLPRVRVSR